MQTQDDRDALEKALRALTAEKSANDLLLEGQKDMRKRIDELSYELSDSKKTNALSKSELNSLRAQVSSLQTDNMTIHEDAKVRESVVKAKEGELKEIKAKLDVVNSQLVNANSLLKKLQGNTASDSEMSAARKRIADLEAELAKMKKDLQVCTPTLPDITPNRACLPSFLIYVITAKLKY